MSQNSDTETGMSQVMAIMLLVAITVILFAIFYLYIMNFGVHLYTPPEKVPTIFKIRKISSDAPKYESKIILFNAGLKPYNNSQLEAEIYSNDVLLGCRIKNMNGHEFIPTLHFFVKNMWGNGCKNTYWNPGEKTGLDLTDGLLKPGDKVRVDILIKPDRKVISTDTFIVP